MISFFKNVSGSIIAVDTDHKLENSEIEKLKWLFNDAQLLDASTVEGKFVGPVSYTHLTLPTIRA